MSKELWLNLPVKDIRKSKAFYTRIGFALNPQHPNNDDAVSLIVGDNKVVVMLFPESAFKGFIRHEVADTKQAAEVLISIGADSREEVDAWAKKAAEAGGTVFCEPEGEGWLYSAGFADLDGHRWNVLYMDMSRMP